MQERMKCAYLLQCTLQVVSNNSEYFFGLWYIFGNFSYWNKTIYEELIWIICFDKIGLYIIFDILWLGGNYGTPNNFLECIHWIFIKKYFEKKNPNWRTIKSGWCFLIVWLIFLIRKIVVIFILLSKIISDQSYPRVHKVKCAYHYGSKQ